MPLDLLILGDPHIPDRQHGLPEKLRKKINNLRKTLSENRFDFIFFTGDFTDSPKFYRFLIKQVNKDLQDIYAVMGNMDYYHKARGNISEIKRKEKISKSLHLNGHKIRIGMIHGHQIKPRGDEEKLTQKANQMRVDILLSGHTHASAYNLTKSSVLLLNPGSATGAWSFLADKTPSFMHLRLEGGDNSAKNALSSEDGILISLNLYCLIGHEQLSEKRLRYKKIEEKICRIGR